MLGLSEVFERNHFSHGELIVSKSKGKFVWITETWQSNQLEVGNIGVKMEAEGIWMLSW